MKQIEKANNQTQKPWNVEGLRDNVKIYMLTYNFGTPQKGREAGLVGS